MDFVKVSKKVGFVGVKGHRFIRGLRDSLYNAIPIGHMEVLIKYMKDYEVERMKH